MSLNSAQIFLANITFYEGHYNFVAAVFRRRVLIGIVKRAMETKQRVESEPVRIIMNAPVADLGTDLLV